MPCGAQQNAAAAERFVLAALGCGAPEQRTDAGKQLHDAERLGEVVVRAAVQTEHLVILGAACGEHHNGQHFGRGIAAEPAEHGEAVFLGQHNVQQNDIRRALLDGSTECRRQGKAADFIARTFDCIDRKIPDVLVILQQINHGILPDRFIFQHILFYYTMF